MAEKIAVENGWISNFQGLVTLTSDRVIPHTVMHQSSTSTYIPNFIEIAKTFCGWTDERRDAKPRGQGGQLTPLFQVQGPPLFVRISWCMNAADNMFKLSD